MIGVFLYFITRKEVKAQRHQNQSLKGAFAKQK